jgi:hypothetical protein
VETPDLEEFRKALKRRRDLVQLLSNYMRERIEVWTDQDFGVDIRREARHSGYGEADAVEIVRRHRLTKSHHLFRE